MAHWAFQANPSRFDILRSIVDHDDTTWSANQYTDQIQPGDRALIWLSGDHSGGYALGEVTAAAAQMPEDPRFSSYWAQDRIDDDLKNVPRVRLRLGKRLLPYPLLRKFCQDDSVLSQMHVVRSPMGTVFKITNEQWGRIEKSIRPRSEVPTREEMFLILSYYFDEKSKLVHQPEDMVRARLARLIDRDPKDLATIRDHLTHLDPERKGKGLLGATAETKEIWAELGQRPDEVRREATRIRNALLEGGGLDHVREVTSALSKGEGTLTLGRSLAEIRASLVRFNAQAPQAKPRAQSLLQSTTYWVFDPTTGNFGPAKLVGFAGIDFMSYEAALGGHAGGDTFNGGTARASIEKVLGMEFRADARLAAKLQAWGEALAGPGIFEGATEGPNKWKFLALPGPDCRYWKIAPGEQAVHWKDNSEKGLIAIGWGQAGDPRSHTSKEALESHYGKFFKYTKVQAQSSVRAVHCFLHEIKPGDIIVANRGQSGVKGRGVVLGPADFMTERGEYGNILPIHWFDLEGRNIPQQKSWLRTILPMSSEVYEALFGSVDPDIDDGDNNDDEDGEPPIHTLPNLTIYDHIHARGLHFPRELVTTYLLSLKTKPFVILSGISGTGKTKLAQEVAEWAGSTTSGASSQRHEFVSVRPDWLDGKEVLGFYNVLTERYDTRPFLNLLLRAHRDHDVPHFVILDEMNLARVEHYFADLLSVLESRSMREGKLHQEALHLHDEARCLPLTRPKEWVRPARCAECRATEREIDACPLYLDGEQMIPPRLKVAANVHITGTVNIDETTHMFSPKVLDRANVIEFNEVDLDGYGASEAPSKFSLQDGRIALGTVTVAHQDHFKNAPEKVQKSLSTLNRILAAHNLHFGYRVANEIGLYVETAAKLVGLEAVGPALDLQILQKVLPKFHGSKQKLMAPLWRVLLFTLSGEEQEAPYADPELDKIEAAFRKQQHAAPPVMPRSAAKLVRMLRTLRAQGFVSFIE